MKVLGSVLILVIAVHSQCLNACPIELLLAATSAEPPCHQARGASPNSTDGSGTHETNACGLGLVVEAKAAPKLKSSLDAFSLPVLSMPPVVSGVYSQTTAVSLTLYPTVESSSPPLPQRPILRI